MTSKSRIASILFWSVISAAFIGPGTLATASAAGATFEFALIWALLFATLACIVLQEMAARISIATKMDLGKNMLSSSSNNIAVVLIAFSVILGCAAYQAGNILGAIAGLSLIMDLPGILLTLIVGLVTGTLLWFGSVKQIAQTLGVIVAIMGLLFLIVALKIDVSSKSLINGAVVPSIPGGSEWLILGLIGTTIVPYNLFLGSGIGQDQNLKEMRFGLIISVLLGGLVSIAILVVGTEINEKASFQTLATVVGNSLGGWAKIMMALGLFAAGLTSSITSPLAAAVIGKSMFDSDNSWTHQTLKYRMFWLIVLIIGLIFGLIDVKPLPIIIAAQALNGLILPLIAIIIIIKANDRKVVKSQNMNPVWLNVIALAILNFVIMIGLNNVVKASLTALSITPNNNTERFIYLQLIAIPVMGYTIWQILKKRK